MRVALRDEGGATAVEYALLAGIIGVGTLVALEGIRNWVNEVGTNVGDELNSASTP